MGRGLWIRGVVAGVGVGVGCMIVLEIVAIRMARR